MAEVADMPALHCLYAEDSPWPKDALGIALGLWSDEVQLTKSTGRKIHVVVLRVLNIWKVNMDKEAMNIIVAAFPSFNHANDKKSGKALKNCLLVNHMLKHVLDPLFDWANGNDMLPIFNIGGHDMKLYPSIFFLSADLKEMHELYGTYMSLHPDGYPIPFLNVKTKELTNLTQAVVANQWTRQSDAQAAIDGSSSQAKGTRAKQLGKLSQRPVKWASKRCIHGNSTCIGVLHAIHYMHYTMGSQCTCFGL